LCCWTATKNTKITTKENPFLRVNNNKTTKQRNHQGDMQLITETSNSLGVHQLRFLFDEGLKKSQA